ncbi:MAG TPA: hypothetical protein ENJ83_03425 [Rhodospirillales bacterium]|nr:hypothetical protein [Rhodospirillales bacterium]
MPCHEELDVKALLRDLRKRQLAGYDCGDPCDEKEPDARTYGLYLTYTETLEEPVAPYASGDPCGQQACEPTRVCEGYRFELRCECEQPVRPDVFNRIAACIGDLKQAAVAMSKAQSAGVQARRLYSAAQAVRAEAPIPFDDRNIELLRKVTPELARLNEISLEDDLDENGLPKRKPDERELRLDVARLQLLTGALTRFRALPKDSQAEVLKAHKGLAELLKDAEHTVAEAGPRIEALVPRVIKAPAARTEAEESVRLSRKYVVGQPSEERLATVEAKMVALNTPVSVRQLNRMKSDAVLLKDWLLDKLAGADNLTRCDLYERLRRVQIDAPPGTAGDGDLAEINASAGAVKELVQILVEYLIDCICLALNPPCQPCEDRSVLLACLTVKDCEVTDICNMSRRFVLSPLAMRYWLPPIGMIGELLDRLCCEFDVGKLFSVRERKPVEGSVDEFVTTGPEQMVITRTYAPILAEAEIDEDTALVLKRFRIEPRDLADVTAFSSNLALLSLDAAAVEPAAVASRGAALAAIIGRRLGGAAPLEMDDATIRIPVAEAVADEMSGVRKRMERELNANVERAVDAALSSARPELSAAITRELGGTFDKRVAGDVKAAVARELTEAKLRRAVQGIDTIKALKEENRKLARELKRLTTAVEALQKGANP